MRNESPPPVPQLREIEWESADPSDVLDYNADEEVYRASFDSTTESVDMAVVMTVALVSGTEPFELPPLYSAIDPDLLDEQNKPTVTGPQNTDFTVSFTYYGWDVTVHSDGIIAVQPSEGSQKTSTEELENK